MQRRSRAPVALVGALLVAMALYHLYAAIVGVPAQVLRPVHVGFVLALVFLLCPWHRHQRQGPGWWDVACALVGAATIAFLLAEGASFWARHHDPKPSDVFFGTALILLVLEACRRAAGWGLPIVATLLLACALAGPWQLGGWHHPGYDIARITALLYQSPDGIFGTAIGVSAALVVPFSIFGAFLEHSGARRFFLDWSGAAAGAGPRGTARTVALWSILRGGSAESVATVAEGVDTVGGPRLALAGYGKDAARGVLAGCAVGAVVAPPVPGAVGFMLVGFLAIAYLDVLRMATIPALLYGVMLLVMMQLDFRRLGIPGAAATAPSECGSLLHRNWHHLVAPVAFVALLLLGFSPTGSVLLAIAGACLLSFRSRRTAMGVSRIVYALRDGARRSLDVAATCAAAGVVVGIASATGLTPEAHAILIACAGGSLPLVALCAGLVVAAMGVVLRATAAYIVGATLVAPALTSAGAHDIAAHMFVFYVAVLAALSSPAVAPIAGGNPLQSMLQGWKYTLPALVLPFAFVLDPAGIALLLEVPSDASWSRVAWIAGTAIVGMAALAAGMQRWLLRLCTQVERWLLIVGGMLLVYPAPLADGIGLATVATVLAWQKFGPRTEPAA
jgi:TRAP transporter 4TM/12TM fusion protein